MNLWLYNRLHIRISYMLSQRLSNRLSHCWSNRLSNWLPHLLYYWLPHWLSNIWSYWLSHWLLVLKLLIHLSISKKLIILKSIIEIIFWLLYKHNCRITWIIKSIMLSICTNSHLVKKFIILTFRFSDTTYYMYKMLNKWTASSTRKPKFKTCISW